MEDKYILGTNENRCFLAEMRENLLFFGRRFPSSGGASYYLGDDGTPLTDRPRETWITSRMAHVYSLASLLKRGEDAGGGKMSGEACRELASRAIDGLRTELTDRENGGWYAGVTADGGVLPDKQCYAHAFVMLAASSGVLAGIRGAEDLLAESIRVYDRYFWEEKEGLARDTWDTAFVSAEAYRGLNANMHSVEAFLAVYDATGDTSFLERAGRGITRVIGWAEENGWRMPEHYSEKWDARPDYNQDKPDDPFKPFGATPGHGIEWARLILQWKMACIAENGEGPAKGNGEGSVGAPETSGVTGAASQNSDLHVPEAAKALYHRAVSDGWEADGAPGFVYTTDWGGHPVVRDRMHWTLAEAINTSAVLYQVTGDSAFRDDFAGYMIYLDQYVIDHEKGSWRHQLDENNQLKTTVWPGKPDLYHAVQATLIPYLPAGVSVAKAVADHMR